MSRYKDFQLRKAQLKTYAARLQLHRIVFVDGKHPTDPSAKRATTLLVGATMEQLMLEADTQRGLAGHETFDQLDKWLSAEWLKLKATEATDGS